MSSVAPPHHPSFGVGRRNMVSCSPPQGQGDNCNDKLCTSDLRHLIQISPTPARRVSFRAPFTPQAGMGRSFQPPQSQPREPHRQHRLLHPPADSRFKIQQTRNSVGSRASSAASHSALRGRSCQATSSLPGRSYFSQTLGLCFLLKISDLVVHNIEFSCASESPLRSSPADSPRLYHESIVHFRRQLQRFVMWRLFITMLNA
jgi:hypothetical protein